MRPFQLSTNVVSIRELKGQVARILQRVNKDRCPIVISQHGKPAALLVSRDDHDQMADQTRLMQAVQRGLNDVQAGRLVDDQELDAALEDAFKGVARK